MYLFQLSYQALRNKAHYLHPVLVEDEFNLAIALVVIKELSARLSL